MNNNFLGKNIFGHTIGLIQRSLDIRTTRHKVLSGNIANADTPDYTAKDLPFQRILEQAAQNSSSLPLRKTHPFHFPEPVNQSLVTSLTSEIEDGPAGQGVSIDQEMAKLAENNLMFQAGVQSLIKKFESIRAVISEGR